MTAVYLALGKKSVQGLGEIAFIRATRASTRDQMIRLEKSGAEISCMNEGRSLAHYMNTGEMPWAVTGPFIEGSQVVIPLGEYNGMTFCDGMHKMPRCIGTGCHYEHSMFSLSSEEKKKETVPIPSQLMERDLRVFEESLLFRPAVIFLNEATLRKKCYVLAVSKSRTPTQNSNLRWHLQSPACKEDWFLECIKEDGFELEDL